MSALFNMPVAASEFAARVDRLLLVVTLITGTVAAGVFVLLITFSIRYRRAAHVDRRLSPIASGHDRNHLLEVLWISVPLLIFVGFYVWGARLYFAYQSAPAQPLEVYVVAKQWMWKLEQPNGRREINELHVPLGRPVKLIMTSQDVIHSFYLPAFRIKHDVLPGRYETLWFTAARVGSYHLFCSEYCGTDHSHMDGSLVVMEPDDYARWLATGASHPTLAASGARAFTLLGCSGCHAAGSAVHAPRLEGLYGTTVPLSDGSFALVDEHYLRDSILDPGAQVAAGFDNIMPSYAGRLSEEQLLELIEYLKSLAGHAAREQP